VRAFARDQPEPVQQAELRPVARPGADRPGGDDPEPVRGAPRGAGALARELAQHARDNPGKLNFGTGGAGTSNHLASDMFRMLTKTEIVQVPYKGAETAMLAVLAGQVQMVVIGPPAAAPHIRSGKLRALAVLGKERLPDLPEVQTAAESGMPGFEVDTWYGVLAPAGVPREVLTRLNGEFTKMMLAGEMRERLAGMGVQPLSSTPERFGEFLKAEVAKWAAVVKESGARAD